VYQHIISKNSLHFIYLTIYFENYSVSKKCLYIVLIFGVNFKYVRGYKFLIMTIGITKSVLLRITDILRRNS